MYLGYVKAGRLDETDQLYKSKLETLKVQKVFSDSKYETTALKELLGYVRQGDNIVVESILDLSISAGEFIELAIKLFRQGVFVVCMNQQIDTSLATWGSILGVLSVFENDTTQGTRGRPTRMIEDIEEYYKQVKDGKVTVDEVCEKLGIGIIHENDVVVNVWGEMTREEQYSYLGWRLGLVRAGIPEQDVGSIFVF